MEHASENGKGQFAHGRVDPSAAGIRSGEVRRARRTTPLGRRLVAGVIASNNGAAKTALARDLGLFERQQEPAPEPRQVNNGAILSLLPTELLANLLRSIDRERLYAALEQLADEEESDAAA